jgi:hypothetical protein
LGRVSFVARNNSFVARNKAFVARNNSFVARNKKGGLFVPEATLGTCPAKKKGRRDVKARS